MLTNITDRVSQVRNSCRNTAEQIPGIWPRVPHGCAKKTSPKDFILVLALVLICKTYFVVRNLSRDRVNKQRLELVEFQKKKKKKAIVPSRPGAVWEVWRKRDGFVRPHRVLFGSRAEWVMGRPSGGPGFQCTARPPPRKGHLSPGVPAFGVGWRPQEAPEGRREGAGAGGRDSAWSAGAGARERKRVSALSLAAAADPKELSRRCWWRPAPARPGPPEAAAPGRIYCGGSQRRVSLRWPRPRLSRVPRAAAPRP